MVGEPRRRKAGGHALVIVAAFLTAWLLFFHTTFLVPDSSGTYAWGRSLLYGGDLDFSDELMRLGWVVGDRQVRFHALTEGGRPGNPFGMGSGLLWIPFLLTAELVLLLAGGGASPGGYTQLHLLAASAGTAVYGLAALLLCRRVILRFVPAGDALAATLAAGLGTPFLAYAVHLPTYAHVNAAFGAALALEGSLQAREKGGAVRWALAGAAVGLSAVVRAQGAALLAIPLALCLPSLRGSRRRGATSLLSLIAGFGLVFGLQVAAWLRIYGGPDLPQGAGFLDLLRPHLLGVLLSPWHGLVPWAPVILLAVPGLALLARRDPALTLGLVVAAGAQIWLVASVPDWWGGYAVGARRLVDLTPVFALGMALGLGWMRRGAGRVPALTAMVAASLWSFLLTVQVRRGLMSPFRRVDWGELIAGQARALAVLPDYLWHELTASRAAIHTIVHRDSPVQPRFDPVPAWTLGLGLALCWALGLLALWFLERRRRG